MKRLIFIALLIMSGCGAAYAQPKVKLPEGVPSDSLSYLKIQKNNRGKYGYVYSSGNTETTYVKPVYDAVSEVLSISDEGTVRHISMVEYRSRWYLLDLANGMYMLLGTQGEFLSCPCLLESGGFIYETDEGRFFCETLADPDEKHVAIQREYALDNRKVFFADGQIYVVLNSKPWKPESFYTHIQVPTPDSTLLVMHKNPSEEEFMLVETKTFSSVERYDCVYYDYDKALVVKKDSTVGVFAANKFVPVKLAAESGTYGHKEVYNYIDKYLSDVIGNEGYHDFVVDHKFDYYTYRTAEGAVVAGSDKGIHYRDDSGKSVISVKDAQFLEIERSGDYGLINLLSGKVTDPIYFRPIDVNRFDRYQTVMNGDMLTDGRNFYTVSEYEIQLRDRFHDVISGFMNYVIGEDLSHDGEYVTPHFYDKCNKAASDYLTDQFLSDEEKIHADEVIELKQKVVTYIDDCLWNELTPLEYAREDLWLKCEDRYHWDEAQAEIAKIVENNPLLIIPQRGPYWSEEKQNVTYEEEWINGNCYLHEIFVSKGFKFRNNALSKKSELILRFKDSETASETDRYFPLESESYKDYSLVCDSLLTDGSYIAYYIHSHNQEMGDTTMTEQPVYERVSEPYVLKVSPEGKLSAERLLYATVSPLKFRNSYFFINSKGNRSSGTFMLDRWNGVEDGKEQYSTVIDIYDYDFTHKYYMSNEGEFIYDIFKWGDKWLFIGSTLNHGYIGYENCYVVLLDSGLKVIDSLHFTDKDTYLSGVEYVGKNRFRLTGNKGTKWMRVNSDNTMEWLDSLATTTPEVVVAEEQ